MRGVHAGTANPAGMSGKDASEVFGLAFSTVITFQLDSHVTDFKLTFE